MFVCLTFENFPDVMLEATAENIGYAAFFIFFTIVGNFFLLSVLLAVIFDNYKNRLQDLQQENVSQRMFYIEQFFDAYDVDGNGWLTMKQTRQFFANVLDLDYRKKQH